MVPYAGNARAPMGGLCVVVVVVPLGLDGRPLDAQDAPLDARPDARLDADARALSNLRRACHTFSDLFIIFRIFSDFLLEVPLDARLDARLDADARALSDSSSNILIPSQTFSNLFSPFQTFS